MKKIPSRILKDLMDGKSENVFLFTLELDDKSQLEDLLTQKAYDAYISSGEASITIKHGRPESPEMDTPGAHTALATPAAGRQTAERLFSSVIKSLEEDLGPEEVTFPREILWLGGAPGAGKGTNTGFIQKARDIHSQPIVMSDLFKSPEMRRIIDQGILINDDIVLKLLLKELTKGKYKDGVIVDGFPRTTVQGTCVECLYRYMDERHHKFADSPNADLYFKPLFRIVVLYVNEVVSVERQIGRGKKVLAHNERVKASGEGVLESVRATDLDPELAKKRYRVFVDETQRALSSFQELFDYHVIDANRPIVEVEKAIEEEFKYQSSLELGDSTFETLRNIPKSADLIRHARQHLVRRLDSYQREHKELFQSVVSVIERDMVPILKRHAFTGIARVRISDTILAKGIARQMLLDVMIDRGFYVKIDRRTVREPARINFETGAIINDFRDEYILDIEWQGPKF
ncbi:putative multi-domain containing protein [Aduncisulcus paluster]|uniref:Multi-domain containing protein n=1 Tax=Aduncisulcus paluster TaxID=2918883 RepID=A0ABQ5K8A7_9EUKA|nr:putative multi-domain containing protein [Aduncisulcus paluster]